MSGVEKTTGGSRIGDQVTDAPVVIARSEGDEAISVHGPAVTADAYVGPKGGAPTAVAILPDGNLNAKIRTVLPDAFPSRVRKAIDGELAGLSSVDLTKEFYTALFHHALEYLLDDEELVTTFPEDIRQALDAKLTLAAREHNRNLMLDVLVPMLAGWKSEAITKFLADPTQLVGLLTWHIPPAVKLQFHLIQAALPGVVEAEMQFRRTLEPQALFAATARRLAKTPGQILAAAEKYWTDKNPGVAAAIRNYPGRSHRQAEAGSPIRHWQLMEALRNLIPQDATAPYTVLELGAGIIGLSPDHPFGDRIKPLHNPEPVELAALLPERGRLRVFDISLLVIECLADGCQQLALVPDVNARIFPGSRDYMDRLSSVGHTETGWVGRVEHRLITANPAITRKIKSHRMDVAVDSFGDDQVDLAFTANMEQYLFETGNEDRFVQINLMKMVHAVKVGGCLVLFREQDSKSLPPLTPAQRIVLGLELVREVPTGQRSTGYIYQKIAATDFVEEMHAQIASVQERARMENLGRMLSVTEGGRILAQGMERKGWQEHAETNKAHILNAAQEVLSSVIASGAKQSIGSVSKDERPTAMVLGAGNCADIPLADLAKYFHVVLVDLDRDGMVRAVAHLPIEFRPYVTLEVRDISGDVVYEVTRNLEAYMELIPGDPDRLMQAVLEHLDDFDVSVPDLTAGGKIDFLVSSMVASQLSVFTLCAFISAMTQNFSHAQEHALDFDAMMADAIISRFRGRVIEAHAVALARFVHATGRPAYYSSDIADSRQIPTATGLTRKTLPVMHHPNAQGMGSLKENLSRYGLAVNNPAQWSWDYADFRDYPERDLEVLRDAGLDPATFVLARKSVEGGILKSDRGPAFAAALPTHIYASSRLGPADQTLASVVLHATIRGGEFDPAHIAPYDKALAEHKIDTLLVADHLFENAIAGIPMRRNDMLGEAIYRDGSGAPRSALDAGIYLAQTEFARVSGLWAYLRDELLPRFDGRDDLVVASFGPGFSIMKLDDTLPSFSTYEPYLLAAYLPATSRVHVYDWAPEVSLATQQFRGRMAIATIWHYAEKETLRPAEEAFLLGRLVPGWREILKNSKAFFERFIAEKGVRVDRKISDRNFEGVDSTIYILEWPEELYRSVIPSPRPRNFIFDVYETEALDLAFFQLGGTDYISGENAPDYSLSVATLIRIVHQLKPGGYLVTDPYVTEAPTETRVLRYSPDPGMMQALGLEAVFDLRATAGPINNKRGIVFRKVGPSNPFVLRMIERIEGAYARARKDLSADFPLPLGERGGEVSLVHEADWSDFFAMYRRLLRNQQIIKHEGENIMIDPDHPEVLGELLVKNIKVREQFEIVLGFLEKDANALQMEMFKTFRTAIALLQDASGKYAVKWDRLVMKVFERLASPVAGDRPLIPDSKPLSEWHARRTIKDDPHRYVRDIPMTDANLELVGKEWMRAIIGGELAQEVARLCGMTREARVAEALERLDLGPQHTWLTASGFICTPASYRVIEELLRGVKHTGPLHLASVGAGYLDLAGATVPYARTLKQLFGMHGLPHAGVTIEAFEMLSYFLPPGTEGSIDVLDWDPRVEAALTEPTGQIIFPVFNALMGELGEFELEFAARVANANERQPGSPHVWHELLYEVLQIPADQRGKLRITETDFATEALPQSPKWHVAFYLQAAYFMPLVVQRAMFIKLARRMAVNGIIVSDFMLSEAEAAMLGISIVYTSNEDVAYEGYLKGAGDRDKHTRFYVKSIASPVVESLAKVIHSTQPTPKHKTVVPRTGTSEVRGDSMIATSPLVASAAVAGTGEVIAEDALVTGMETTADSGVGAEEVAPSVDHEPPSTADEPLSTDVEGESGLDAAHLVAPVVARSGTVVKLVVR